MIKENDHPFQKKQLFFSPPRVITAGFLLMILVGALLLTLPLASANGESVGFVDALFTATSANCVTGLVVVNTNAHWTVFGKAVILLLIQFGGVGYMTVITVGMLILRRRITLQSRLAIQMSFNRDDAAGMVQLVRKVVLYTAVLEGMGAVLLTLSFRRAGFSFGDALIKGIFHAVSAFCNAGFDIIGEASLTPYAADLAINMVIMLLIISGGIGFPVMMELSKKCKEQRTMPPSARRRYLSLHTKVALSVTVFLILLGTLGFLLFEWNNEKTMAGKTAAEKVLACLFQSVTLRTAGFNTIDQGGLLEISKWFSSVLMFIGGSPASTAGGIKTVTLAVLFISMSAGIKGKEHGVIFQRSIPPDIPQKALTVFTAMFLTVSAAVTLLHFTENNIAFSHGFLDLLFEVVSATGTVGVTTGMTPYLTVLGKLILTACMFLGRLGPATVVMALNLRSIERDAGVTELQERVIIG